MQKAIEEFLEVKRVLAARLKDWVKDKTIPLDERWDTFIKSGLGEEHPYCSIFKSKLGNELASTCEQRYESHNVVDFEHQVDELDYTEEDITEYKEEVLNLFIKSWICDW